MKKINHMIYTMMAVSSLLLGCNDGIQYVEQTTSTNEICSDIDSIQLTKTCDIISYVITYKPDLTVDCPDGYYLTDPPEPPADAGEEISDYSCKQCEVTNSNDEVILDGEDAAFIKFQSDLARELCSEPSHSQ